MTLITTVRGIPQVYYGDEVGMVGNKDLNGDGDIRRDFPGGWKGDVRNAFTAEGRTPGQAEFHDFSKKIFNWRKTKSVIHTGKTMQFVPENNVYVYFRHDTIDRVMVVINNNPAVQTLSLNRFKEMIKTAKFGWDVISEKRMVLGNTLIIDGKTSMIIEL